MNDVAIRAHGLGKRYQIGGKSATYRTLRENLLDVAKTPYRSFKSIFRQQLSTSVDTTLWALRNISFEVRQGEVIGLIGSNGAGKTTLLKILTRITRPTEGSLDLWGRVGSLLEVGTGFHPELTGRENILLSGAILGMKRAEMSRRFDEIVDFAEIEKFLDTPVKRYSSGMYMRLAFSVAAHLEPDILLVDEVLAVGDAKFQNKCLGRIGEVAQEGRTVVFVSHNMAAIQRLCNKTILLTNGKLTALGPTRSIIRQYLDRGVIAMHERRWDDPSVAPSSSSSRLQGVKVSTLASGPTSEIRDDVELNLEIDFVVLKPNAKLGTTVVLYNQEGTCIFSSINNRDGWSKTPLAPGLYRSTCRIPGHFLAEGRYSVTIIIWEDRYLNSYQASSVVEFDIHDTGAARGDFTGRMEGVVSPLLDWSSHMVTDG